MATDFIIIGAGIAGAAAAYFLAERGSVALLEREDAPGYHTTGRSAALYTENYGPPAVRLLTKASGAFYREPPAGFTEVPLLHPRGSMIVAPPGQEAKLRQALKEMQRTVATIREISPKEALAICPLLRPEIVAAATYEPTSTDMDVHAIHQGYLRGFRARGGTLAARAEVTSLTRRGGTWTVATRAGDFSAPVVINAAGAWADEVGQLAGARPIGLQPKRRTAFLVDAPAGFDPRSWPMVDDFREVVYFKPESGRILVSPMDETPSPPLDAQPDEIDIAEAVEHLQAIAAIEVTRIQRKWAGLRSFVSDRVPVAGPVPEAPGYHWLAGQGGYGIMTSPAMGRIAAALAAGEAIPADILATGLKPEQVLPGRLFA
ncbi:MAG TPA: FAD-binding oxidoreductase [Stellaceae bacterium]|nr:FAD-binding oxidoreductase [Stellaceae bacterium]